MVDIVQENIHCFSSTQFVGSFLTFQYQIPTCFKGLRLFLIWEGSIFWYSNILSNILMFYYILTISGMWEARRRLNILSNILTISQAGMWEDRRRLRSLRQEIQSWSRRLFMTIADSGRHTTTSTGIVMIMMVMMVMMIIESLINWWLL